MTILEIASWRDASNCSTVDDNHEILAHPLNCAMNLLLNNHSEARQ